MSTKLHATVDDLGNPTGFTLTRGQASDLAGADVPMPQIAAQTVIADKGNDAEVRVLAPPQDAGKAAVILPKRNRNGSASRPYLYEARHLIENCFCKRKQFRAIATRYDKTARNFLAAIYR